jgi:hypothetical protein
VIDAKKQRIRLIFCFKLGKTTTEIHKMLKEAFCDNALSKAQTYEWFKRQKRKHNNLGPMSDQCSFGFFLTL